MLTFLNKLLFLTRLREVVFRYSLVSAPSEHFVMQALVDDFANTIPPEEPHPPPLNTFNVMGMDAINMSAALAEQLPFHQAVSTSAKLRYLTRLTDYGLEVLADSGRSNYLSALEAAFNRLWHEFSCAFASPDRDFVEHVIIFAIVLLRDIV